MRIIKPSREEVQCYGNRYSTYMSRFHDLVSIHWLEIHQPSPYHSCYYYYFIEL